ncbi:MAG: hypothetical protein MJ188_02270 [Treponema sp.]|nr:hypothetical protein [Treponema sp.]
MTLKTRNHLNLILFILSVLTLLIDTIFLVLKIADGSFSIKQCTETIILSNNPSFFLTKYNPLCVIISLYFQIIYVSVTSMILLRSFEKTQASDIIYFYLFLVACLVDTFRLYIPVFKLNNTYSNFLMACGNATVFAKILIPLSLLYTVVMSDVEKRQDIEKNIFLLLLLSIFFAQFIPLNNAIVLPNFSVDYSFKITLNFFTYILMTVAVVTQFFYNKRHLYRQNTAIGYLLICIGISVLFYSTNILNLSIAMICLGVGDFLYLKELHNQYLWFD